MSHSISTNSSLNKILSAFDLSSLAIADSSTPNREKSGANKRALDEGSIFAAIYRDIPQINYSHLTDDKFLGSGSTFHVNRAVYDDMTEPRITYFVAVKYLRFERGKSREQTMQGLMRELKVLTHPFLRGHPHILAAVGYGWAEPGANVIRPFLVFSYADYGTLSELLKAYSLHRDVTLLEQHSLALDVAHGLKALHDSGFVHGDLKADNVLVLSRAEPLGYSFGPIGIPWVAKIADFGSTFTRKDVDDGRARYLGTDKYNAPEIQQDEARPSNSEDDYELYKMADIYSYGLLVWEIMVNGLSYLDSVSNDDILSNQRHWKDYLRNKHEEPGDGLAEVAIRACRERTVEAIDNPLFQSVEAVLMGSLKKIATERLPLDKTVRALEAVSRGDRPPIVHALPRLRSGPPQKNEREFDHWYACVPKNSANVHLRSKAYSYQSRTWSTTHWHHKPPSPESANWQVIPRYQLDGRDVDQMADNSLDLFSIQRFIPLAQTPWKVKEGLVETWNELCSPENDTEVASEVMIELSIAYHLGFGVEPNQQEAVSLLHGAARGGNKTAKSILVRVTSALRDSNGSDPITGEALHYLARRLQSNPFRTTNASKSLRCTQISSRPDLEDPQAKSQSILSLLNSNPHSFGVDVIGVHLLQELWDASATSKSSGECPTQRELCASLTEACRLAATDASRNLAGLCNAYIGRFGDPTPLHWLVSFPFAEAREIFQLLVYGKDGTSERHQGPCDPCLNARTSYSLFVPELRMELLGTPLHWAVRSRNLKLVRLLLDAGADPNIRFKIRPQVVGEPPSPVNIDYTPLDLAIELHLFEIVDMILERLQPIDLSKFSVGTALLATTTTPFARYFIHGPSFRLAIQETIRILLLHGIDLGGSDRFGQVPLLMALKVNAEERYVVEELLKSTVGMVQPTSLRGDNLAALVVRSAETDYASTAWKLEQILPYVLDVNAPDNSGFNALHYCALVDNAPMTRVLLIQQGIDVNRTSEKPKYALTPLSIAAQFGRAEIVRLLLDSGADLESRTENGETALELAVHGRHLDAASLLIEAGASLLFGVSGSIIRSSVLHTACLQASNRPPMVRQLLDKHHKLREKSMVNCFCAHTEDQIPWTPLHLAAQHADLESVEALLEAQADPDLWRCASSRIGSGEENHHKFTAKDQAKLLLDRAARGAFDSGQLRVARVGHPELMKNIEHSNEEMKKQERLSWEDFSGTLQFEFRLEDVRAEKEGQAGTRSFVRRLERIKQLMERASDRQVA